MSPHKIPEIRNIHPTRKMAITPKTIRLGREKFGMSGFVMAIPEHASFQSQRSLAIKLPHMRSLMAAADSTSLTSPRLAKLVVMGLTACSFLPAPAAADSPAVLTVAPMKSPAGAAAQIRVELDRALAIATGGFVIQLDPAIFGPITDVQIFSAAGDALGTAILQGTRADVRFSAISGTIGRLAGVPIATVTAMVLSEAREGASAKITIDPALQPWQDAVGSTMTLAAAGSTLTVGGQLTLQSIMPIGPDTYRIKGSAFTPETRISTPGLPLNTLTFRSSTEIEFSLAGAGEINGQSFTAENADGESVRYIYAAPSIPDTSADPNLRVFLPRRTYSSIGARGNHPDGETVGLVLENPYPEPVEVAVERTLNDAGGFLNHLGRQNFTLPPLGRFFTNNVISLGFYNAPSSRDSTFGGLFPSRPIRAAYIVRPCVRCTPTPSLAVREVYGYQPYRLPLFQVEPLTYIFQPGSEFPTSQFVGYRLSWGSVELPPITATTNQPWLNVTVQRADPSGALLLVELNGSTFIPGTTYRGDITIFSSTPPRPQTIPVTVYARAAGTPYAPPPSPPSPTRLEALSPSALNLYFEPGSAAFLPNIAVRLQPDWFALALTPTTQSGGNWLRVANNGLVPVFYVTIDARTLPPGVYTGSIKVRPFGAENSLDLPVRITVTGTTTPPITVTPRSLGVGGSAEGILTVTSPGEPLTVYTSIAAGPQGCQSRVVLGEGQLQPLTPAKVQVSCRGEPGRFQGSVRIVAGSRFFLIPLAIEIPVVDYAGAVTPPLLSAVTHAAANRTGPIARGQIVTLHGIGRDRAVTFDGLPATVLFESLFQTNVLVPNGLRGKQTAIRVTSEEGISTLAIPVAETVPGLFTLDGSGQGQGAVLNQDHTVNSPSNPAAPGSIVQIFATGIIASGRTRVTIGGREAVILFDGLVPQAGPGLFQINAVVPADAVPNPATPITLQSGDIPAQSLVTIAVR